MPLAYMDMIFLEYSTIAKSVEACDSCDIDSTLKYQSKQFFCTGTPTLLSAIDYGNIFHGIASNYVFCYNRHGCKISPEVGRFGNYENAVGLFFLYSAMTAYRAIPAQ